MNVTGYQSKADEKKVYFGNASIKKGYYIATGDENFYNFIGTNSCYSLLELIHDDDVEDFSVAVDKLSEGTQCLILRVKCYNNKYRWLYMKMKYNGRVLEGFQSFDIEFNDIMSINDNYLHFRNNIKKYREFMSLSSQMYFEYEFESDTFKIYRYFNTKSYPKFMGKLEDIRSKVTQLVTISASNKANFETLYAYIKKGSDRFDVIVDAAIFEEKQSNVVYKIRGGTIYKDDNKNLVVGTIRSNGEDKEQKAYYLMEAATDPGTGLINKRAISEYAIEKISNNHNGLYFAIMDVDDFKRINDGYGHMFGDEVISKVSEVLRSVMSARGVAGRFGGDEFMLIFDGIDTEEDLRRIMKTIAKHIEWAYTGVINNFKVTVSVGIAKFPNDGSTYEELFKKADKSLYIAKEKGKNRFIIYDEKKHGAIKNDNDRIIGIKSIADNHQKTAAVSEMVIDLHTRGTAAVVSTLEKMTEYFDMDGIAVYANPDMKRICSVGKYIEPIQNLTFINDSQYIELFDKNGVYVESTIRRLDGKVQDAYEMYQKQENGKFIQCAAHEDGVVKAVVSFDFFNRSPKYGESDTNLITILGKLIADVAYKN